MKKKLAGKIALVTCSVGTEIPVAQILFAEGALVFISGPSQQELDVAITKIGEGVIALQGNPAILADVDHVLSTVKRQTGRIDVLVVDAGIDHASTLEHVTEAEFDRNFNINVRGLLFTVQLAIPILADGASVVLLGARTADIESDVFSTADAAHSAVRAFADVWSAQLRHRNITVTVSSAFTADNQSSISFLF
jgi:NAD(P)-dependent dehydrogenase (short-subunit alcohol dehydrogenase family)